MSYKVLAQELGESLTYRMSLGSKELYHSNVWAWLMENDHSFVQCFFDDVKPENVDKITREEGHRDITIHLKNSDKVLVIENKLKSIPSQRQLNDYSHGLGESFLLGLLTGLEPTTIVDLATNMVNGTSKPWRFKKYDNIARSIREVLDASQNQVIQDNKEIIAQYCDDIDKMNHIVSATLEERKEVFFHSHDDSLEKLGLNDLINKVNGGAFSLYFWKRVAENQLGEDQLDIKSEHYFRQWEAFNRKQCTLEFRYSSYDEKKKDAPYFVIGIELQGGTYRRDVEIKNNGSLSADGLFHLTSEMGYFSKDFDGKKSDKNRRILLPGMKNAMPTKMTGTYCKYEVGYLNLYQYFNLEDATTGKYDTLYRMIINDLGIARPIFEKRELFIHPKEEK